jgi:hypothetical protein
MKMIEASKKKKVDISEDNDIGSSVRGSIGKSNKSPSRLYRGTRNLQNTRGSIKSSNFKNDDLKSIEATSPSKFGRLNRLSDEED